MIFFIFNLILTSDPYLIFFKCMSKRWLLSWCILYFLSFFEHLNYNKWIWQPVEDNEWLKRHCLFLYVCTPASLSAVHNHGRILMWCLLHVFVSPYFIQAMRSYSIKGGSRTVVSPPPPPLKKNTGLFLLIFCCLTPNYFFFF